MINCRRIGDWIYCIIMVDASHISEFLKVILAPRYLFGIWLVGALALFLPEELLGKLGLIEFLNAYRGWVGIVTLLVFCIWISLVGMQIFGGIRKLFSRRASGREFDQTMATRLSSLSQQESFYLLMCLERSSQTFIGCFFDGHTSSLISKGFLQPANNSDPFNCPLTIPDPVWSYLQEHKAEIMPDDPTELRNLIDSFRSVRAWQRKNFLQP